MRILVANVGSSSYKCRLFDMPAERDLAGAEVERVGSPDAIVSYRRGGTLVVDRRCEPVPDHRHAVQRVLALLTDRDTGVVESLDRLDGIGFKTVQAGPRNGSVLLGPEVIAAMEEFAPLFPAHNPPYLACIRYFLDIAPQIPLVGVFEPGFHAEIPEAARIFGLPYEWYRDFHVRKYGFHGATFRFVTGEVVRRLGLDPARARIIACHLGGSSSICAFGGGRSVDTSFSFTTQSGVLQTSRFGDVDPYAFLHVMRRKGISFEQALEEASTRGGLFGISGVGKDMREIKAAAAAGNERALLAIDKLVYDIVRHIGAYHVLLQGVDAIAFSGGMGLRDADLRARVIERVAFLGVELDPELNRDPAEGVKTRPGSKIAVVTVATNEEVVVAREAARVLGEGGAAAWKGQLSRGATSAGARPA
jgi:acetate kinase